MGAQLTNKTHFCCTKLNFYEHLQILWGHVPSVPPSSATYVIVLQADFQTKQQPEFITVGNRPNNYVVRPISMIVDIV